MSIYDYLVSAATDQLTPPSKRKPVTFAWLGIFTDKLQYLHDLVFTDYANGSGAGDWVASSPYVYTTRKRYIDNYIYEVINPNGIISAIPPPQDLQTLNNPTGSWVKVLNNWVGVRERSKYNSQRVVFEYALNKWFKTNFVQFTGWDTNGMPTPSRNAIGGNGSDIYITDNPYDTNEFSFGVDDTESSAIAFDEGEQMAFIGNQFVYQQQAFTIFMPVAVYNALGIDNTHRESIVRAFADLYVLGGLNYNIITY